MNFKNFNVKHLTLGSVFALLIAISPYIFYAYESFPEERVWETFLFDFETSYYPTLYMAAWNAMNKIVPLYLLFIWFITCKDWWYHVLLIPISMYIFQLASALNDDLEFVDEVEIYYIIPVMMIVIPIVYFIRLKIFDKVVHGIDLKAIDQELKEYEIKEKQLKEETSLFNY